MFRQKLTKRHSDESGFTLVELLVVIVILGILAAVVVFSVAGVSDKGKTSACKSDIKSVEAASEAYYAKNSKYPAAISDLTASPDKFLHSVPSSSDYTIALDSTTGDVTATHGGTAGCP